MRVLVAEDGVAVDVANDGADALFKARVHPYDVVVLDRDLPQLHGDEVCRTLVRERPEVKILMLTAARSLDEMVDGLSLGADDYLPKPVRFAELVARVTALARRNGQARRPVLAAGDLELDPARRVASRGGRPLALTPKEFGVLEVLLGAQGAVVSSEELLERVWDENADPFTNTGRMVVMTLRLKVGDPPVIHTVQGAGYRV